MNLHPGGGGVMNFDPGGGGREGGVVTLHPRG